MKSSELNVNMGIFSENSLTIELTMNMIEAEGKSNLVFMNSCFVNNKISGIISASMADISINSCCFIDNIVTELGIIYTGNALLAINNSTISNNTVLGSYAFSYDNAAIRLSTITHNAVRSGYGLIDNRSGKPNSSLWVEQSTFLYNKGDVIRVYSSVDIVLDACNFTGNIGDTGILHIQDDWPSLRTSNTTIIAPAMGNKVATYFIVTSKGTTMTDYMTYDTCFISGNTTVNSSSTDNFLQEAEAAGMVLIDKQAGSPYTVTQEETEFASCKCNNIFYYSYSKKSITNHIKDLGSL